MRAHGAGLACPDWPLCHGQAVPEFDFRIAFEWGHRAMAGSLSLGLVALASLIVSARELRARFAAPLAWAVVGLLGLQVVLGGLTVLLGLAPWTVTGHLLVGNSFALGLAWLARDLLDASADEPVARPALGARQRTAVFVTGGLVVMQLALGVLVSSHYAGLACATFPLCNGDSLAPTFAGPVGLHVLHRLNGYALAVAVAVVALSLRDAGRAGRLAQLAFALVMIQIAVGAANVLLRVPVEITALHSALAAGIALTTGLLTREALRSARAPVAAPTRAHALGGVR